MKLLFAYRPKQTPPRSLHVFSILAGTLVSARSYCGIVRPESEVLSVVKATGPALWAFTFGVENAICEHCRKQLSIFAHQQFNDPRFERDEQVLARLKW
jgi:hypothetical protein